MCCKGLLRKTSRGGRGYCFELRLDVNSKNTFDVMEGGGGVRFGPN